MNPKKRQIYKIFTALAVPVIIFTSLFAVPPAPALAADCSDVYTGLSTFVVDGVNSNKSFYVEASNATNVPWEMLAAIHYRETNFSHYNPSNGQGIFQFVNGEGGPYPTGPVSDAEFKRQLTFMASKIQSDYVYRNGINPGAVSIRKLVKDETDTSLVKNTLFSYNGRATVYRNQAANYGYDPGTQPFEGSPYVMNRFDCGRARMGIITRDYGGLDGQDTRYGAFTIYARLKGDAYWLGLQQPYLYQNVSQEVYWNSNLTNPVPKLNDTYAITQGAQAYAKVTVRNIGNTAWPGDITKLGTQGPQDRSSTFAQGWIQPWRAARASENTVNPGGTATFVFPVKAPTTPAFYNEIFRVVLDGRTWINNNTTALNFSISAPMEEKTKSSNFTLKPGQSLTRGQNIISTDRHSVMHMSFDGSIEIWTNFKRTWSSNTNGSGADRVVNQTDGNLVLYKGNQAVWASNTYAPASGGGNLTLQSDGNLVLYQNTSAIWASNTVTYDQTNYALPSAGSDQVIFPGQELSTPNRYYRLVAQEDGNIVLYTPTRAIWSSGTYMSRFNKLIIQTDGNIVAYDGNNYATWSSGTFMSGGNNFILQEDGNLVHYSPTRAVWSSGTSQVK